MSCISGSFPRGFLLPSNCNTMTLIEFSPHGFSQLMLGIQTTDFQPSSSNSYRRLPPSYGGLSSISDLWLSSLSTQGAHLRKLKKRKTLLLRKILSRKRHRGEVSLQTNRVCPKTSYHQQAAAADPGCLIKMMIQSWESVTLVNQQVDLVSVLKDTIEFSLWD